MSFKYLIPVVAGLSLITQQGVATLRIDLDDRSPAEVLSKAKSMAQTYQGSNVVGSLLINEGELASAIALDPWTVLTAAHMENLKNVQSLTFKLGANALLDSPAEAAHMKAQSIKVKPIIHPDFRWVENPIEPSLTLDNKGVGRCGGVLLKETETYTIDQFHNSQFRAATDFEGVDLAIVKLTTPLPTDLDYPEFLPLDTGVSNMLAASIGYGPMKANAQDRAPYFFSSDELARCAKHLISVKVSAYQQPAPLKVHLLHGTYKGLIVNGDESFVPTPEMLKTEGLPVVGDSGGPLFVKLNDKPMLAGIMSDTLSIYPLALDNALQRHSFAGQTQPVFPAWIDVRHYQDWIKSHMGPKK